MKNHALIIVSAIAVGISTLFGGCNVEDDNMFLTTTIKHSGIDWSDGGAVPTDYSNADGETIGWCSIGTQIQGVTGIWYRSNTTSPVMYNLGNVGLSSVKSFDAGLADTDVCDSPIIVGDVWVIDCKDGYVKFKVTSVDDVQNSVDWAVGVEYEFSVTTSFN